MSKAYYKYRKPYERLESWNEVEILRQTQNGKYEIKTIHLGNIIVPEKSLKIEL